MCILFLFENNRLLPIWELVFLIPFYSIIDCRKLLKNWIDVFCKQFFDIFFKRFHKNRDFNMSFYIFNTRARRGLAPPCFRAPLGLGIPVFGTKDIESNMKQQNKRVSKKCFFVAVSSNYLQESITNWKSQIFCLFL